jgi:hypothetical protein
MEPLVICQRPEGHTGNCDPTEANAHRRYIGVNYGAPSTIDRDALLEIALRHLGHTVKRCLWEGQDRGRCSCASCCAWRWSLDDSALAAWRREMGK